MAISAENIKSLIKKKFPEADIEIIDTAEIAITILPKLLLRSSEGNLEWNSINWFTRL